MTAARRPDHGRSQSEGVVVQARLVARLFGRLRLLSIEGTVVISPARIDALVAQDSRSTRGVEPRLDGSAVLSPPVGARLADVARDLDVNLRRLEAVVPDRDA